MKANLLQKNIPEGWEIKKIKDLLDFEQPTKYIVESSSYTPTGKTAVLTANKSFVLGYTNETDGVYTNTPAIIFDDFTTDSKYVDFPFKIKSSAIKILTSRDENTDLKFVYEIMKSFTFPIANHKRHYISQYQELDIVVPTTPEQKRIANILASVDTEIKKIDDIVYKTEKLKIGFTKEVFSRGIKHTQFKKTQVGIIPEEWDIVSLESISKNLNNKRIPVTKSDRNPGPYPYYGASGIVGYVEKYIFEEELLLISEDGANLKDRNYPIAFVAHGKYWVNNHAHIHKFEDKSLQTYVQNYLNSINLESYLTGTAQPKLNKEKLFSIPIPKPKEVTEIKKIAEIFTSIDRKIFLQKELKEGFVKLKKGLVSDLLSGKVRTVQI